MPATKKDVSGQLESLTLDFKVGKNPLGEKRSESDISHDGRQKLLRSSRCGPGMEGLGVGGLRMDFNTLLPHRPTERRLFVYTVLHTSVKTVPRLVVL